MDIRLRQYLDVVYGIDVRGCVEHRDGGDQRQRDDGRKEEGGQTQVGRESHSGSK